MAVFDIIPNVGIQETWEWKTDVITTIDGTEQRQSIRPRPRILQEASFGPLDDAQRRSQWLKILENVKSVFQTPLWAYSTLITQETASGNSRVYFDPRFVPTADDGILIFIDTVSGLAEGHFISSMETDGATLLTNLANTINSTWVVCPGVQMDINNAGFSLGPASQTLRIEFESREDPAVQRAGTSASLTTLSSIPVLERKFVAGARENFNYISETVDFEAGPRTRFSQYDSAQVGGPRQFVTQRVLDPTDFDYWRLFLDTVRGQWKAFYISTQKPDMTLASTPTANGSSISVDQNNESLVLQFPQFSQIEILYTDGTSSYHEVTSVSGSGPYTLALSPNLPNDAKVASVSRVSYLLKARMADTVQFNHGPLATDIAFDITGTDYG